MALNNRVLDHFSPHERHRIGVHTCPGGDRDATHSADVDYAGLLPVLFRLRVSRFYIQLASEKDPVRVLKIIREYMKPEHRVFVGVVSPINPHVDTPDFLDEPLPYGMFEVEDVVERPVEVVGEVRGLLVEALGRVRHDSPGASPATSTVNS